MREFILGVALSDALARADSALDTAMAAGRKRMVVADGGNRGA